MRISIIIPVYNAAKTLKKCVESLLLGTNNNVEIIMVDDGSTDESYQVCKKLVEHDCRLKLLHQANSGAAAARNAGLKIATGDYIGFVDSDDIVAHNIISILCERLNNKTPDILWYNLRCVNEKNEELFITTFPKCGEISHLEYLSCFYGMNLSIGSLWSKLYRRQFLKSHGLELNQDLIYGEDWDFNLRCALLNPKVFLIPDILYTYVKYQSVSTVSTRYNERDFVNFCESYQRLFDIAKEYRLAIPQDEQDSIFIYNVISHLIKLFTSNVSGEQKQAYFENIVQAPVFKNVVRHGVWDGRYMSKRQYIVGLLLKKRMYDFAKYMLKL